MTKSSLSSYTIPELASRCKKLRYALASSGIITITLCAYYCTKIHSLPELPPLAREVHDLQAKLERSIPLKDVLNDNVEVRAQDYITRIREIQDSVTYHAEVARYRETLQKYTSEATFNSRMGMGSLSLGVIASLLIHAKYLSTQEELIMRKNS